MTLAQREIAELLKSFGRPAELISVNAELPIEAVKVWLKTGRWPESIPTQQTLFEAQPLEPTAKPATVGHSHGLRLFAQVAGEQDRQPTSTHSLAEQGRL